MQGAVKFNCHWSQSGALIPDEQYEIINYWRDVLYNMDLIGAYENGISFGNLSIRIPGTNQFFITGSSTGEITELEPGHYVKVISSNIEDNAIQCVGPLKTSSESLTHAAIYSADAGANAVIHVHDHDLWSNLIHKVPTTNPAMEYGTAGLAKDILRLFNDPDIIEKRIIIMAGDHDGLLTFGNDIDEAVNVLMHHKGKL